MEPPSRFGGEARVVRVVYFLCRNGVVEQPHHIHHLHRSGVNLQDVKRWLSELRGKEAGESFAWSYKRRYKTGFVWQDVKDYEFITPISDNEYVLMGSELPHEHTNPLFETFTPGEKTPEILLELQLETTVNTMPETQQIETNVNTMPETQQIDRDQDRVEIISPKPPLRQDQDSPRATVHDSPRATVHPIINRPESPVAPPIPLSTSSSTSDASKQMVVIKVDAWKQNGARVQAEKKRRQETEKEHSGACLGGKGGSGTCLGGKGGSCNAFYSGSGKKASNVFQNFLKPCRAVSTDDSVMPGVRRRERDMLAGGVAGEVPTYRSLDGSNRNTRMGRERVVSAVYMPAAEPNCSQCGKSFNPEKLHSHMKSCKALRRSRKD